MKRQQVRQKFKLELTKAKNIFLERDLKTKVMAELKRCLSFESVYATFLYDIESKSREFFEGGEPEKKTDEKKTA